MMTGQDRIRASPEREPGQFNQSWDKLGRESLIYDKLATHFSVDSVYQKSMQLFQFLVISLNGLGTFSVKYFLGLD